MLRPCPLTTSSADHGLRLSRSKNDAGRTKDGKRSISSAARLVPSIVRQLFRQVYVRKSVFETPATQKLRIDNNCIVRIICKYGSKEGNRGACCPRPGAPPGGVPAAGSRGSQ